MKKLVNYQDIEKSANTIILDIRKPEEYAAGHLDKAINFLRTQMMNSDQNIASLIIDQFSFEKVLVEMGVNNDSKVYVYDARASYDSSFFWYVARVYGFDNVYIIDGGIDGIKFDGVDLVTQEFKSLGNGNIKLCKLNCKNFASLVDVITTDSVLLDVRGISEYSGQMIQSGSKKGGRIKGSINIDYIRCVDVKRGNRFYEVSKLSELLQPVMSEKGIVAYCQAGIRSALVIFVLIELLDYQKVKNYVGSWMEYSQYDLLAFEVDDA